MCQGLAALRCLVNIVGCCAGAAVTERGIGWHRGVTCFGSLRYSAAATNLFEASMCPRMRTARESCSSRLTAKSASAFRNQPQSCSCSIFIRRSRRRCGRRATGGEAHGADVAVYRPVRQPLRTCFRPGRQDDLRNEAIVIDNGQPDPQVWNAYQHPVQSCRTTR